MPTCTWTKKSKGKVVETCRLEAQADSAFCPRHTYLYNLDMQREHERDEERKALAEDRHLSSPRTRVQHCAAGFVFGGSSVCRCGARIEWWRTPKLRNAPYNPMPEQTSIAVSHFVTCRYSSAFRRDRERETA